MRRSSIGMQRLVKGALCALGVSTAVSCATAPTVPTPVKPPNSQPPPAASEQATQRAVAESLTRDDAHHLLSRFTFGPKLRDLESVEKTSAMEWLAWQLEPESIDDSGVEARVGPYARLRPGTELGPRSHVGNFVEVKNTRLGADSKANHLSYVGDADVGERVNIGAGTITCNYDGVNKHRTVIEDDAFIGSDTQLRRGVTSFSTEGPVTRSAATSLGSRIDSSSQNLSSGQSSTPSPAAPCT